MQNKDEASAKRLGGHALLCAPEKRRETMNLDLPGEINDFVKGLISQGRLDSEQSAVVEGVRLLMEHIRPVQVESLEMKLQ